MQGQKAEVSNEEDSVSFCVHFEEEAAESNDYLSII